MQLEDLGTILEDVLPGKVVYLAWPVGEAPPLPFICYAAIDSDNFAADNIVYFSRTSVQIELYTANKDLTTQGALESALTSAGVFWERSEDYIESEHCYEIVYEVTI